MSDFQIDKNTYATDARFQSLRESGVSYENFSANQSFYLRKLSTTSVYDLYNKGKAMYEQYTALYNQQNNVFIQLKNLETQKFNKYNELITIYANRNGTGEATSAEKRSAVLNSGYTIDLIRTTTDAEIMTNVYLSQRQNAVDTQRRGLMG